MHETGGNRVVRWTLALLMVAIGITHFVRTDAFVAIIPTWLPMPLALVLLSGTCEIAGGLGLLLPPVRRAAAIGLILLFVAVFPASINAAVHRIDPFGVHMPPVLLWARLPFQLVFIAWAWWLAAEPSPDERARRQAAALRDRLRGGR